MLELRPVSYDHPDAVALTAGVQRYYVGLYGSGDATPFTAAEFAPPAGSFLVGYLDDRPVAMGGWRFSDAGVPSTARRPAEVKRMYVAPPYQRQGLARIVLDRLEDDARIAGADWMILQTGAPQAAAIAFYSACGYAPVERYGFYADYDDAVNLGKSLR